MKSFMESQKDSVFMKSNHAGVTRVINSDGDYAFLMESNSIQYQIERMFDLIQVSRSSQIICEMFPIREQSEQ